MTFIWPPLLLTLLLLPGLVIGYRRLEQRRRARVAGLGALVGAGAAADRRRHVPPALYLAAVALLLAALARPEMTVRLPRIEGTVILVFDVSSSMLADDLEPSRLEAAKAAARRFIARQPSTVRVGVVAFSNGGLIIQPPTNVPADSVAAVDRLTPQGATSLGQGIFTALGAIAGAPLAIDEAALADARAEGRPPLGLEDLPPAVIVLLSDGENTGAPDPLDVAQVAAEVGVRIVTVGVGSAEGTVLEVDGFNVVTQLDAATLQALADLTNGTYFPAEDEAALQAVYDDVERRLTVRGEKTEVTSLLAGLSLLLLAAGGGLSLWWFGRIP